MRTIAYLAYSGASDIIPKSKYASLPSGVARRLPARVQFLVSLTCNRPYLAYMVEQLYEMQRVGDVTCMKCAGWQEHCVAGIIPGCGSA
jgi:hypothetical protein